MNALVCWHFTMKICIKVCRIHSFLILFKFFNFCHETLQIVKPGIWVISILLFICLLWQSKQRACFFSSVPSAELFIPIQSLISYICFIRIQASFLKDILHKFHLWSCLVAIFSLSSDDKYKRGGGRRGGGCNGVDGCLVNIWKRIIFT